MKIILPIYYATQKEGKILVGLNKYERLHYMPRNEMKQYFYMLVRSQLPKNKIKGAFTAHYNIYYKNVNSDAPNIVAIIEKLVIDALQLYKRLEKDSMKYYVGASWRVIKQDKTNPRCEVVIKGIDV